jgi:DNA-binding NarL/FixJ family response regulator
MSRTVRVLLIDTSVVVRAGLRIALHEGGHTEVAGEAATGQAAVQLAAELRPDVVIMDCALSDMEGSEAIRRIKAAAPQVRVLIFASALSGPQIQAALRAGAGGFLPKHCALTELHAAVLRVAAGQRVLHPEVWQALHGLKADRPGAPSLDTLSEREREVLAYLAAGATSKEIALTLRLSPKTVENHRSRILEKLEVNSTAAAVRVAVAHGLIDAFAPPSASVPAPVGEGTPRMGR